MISKFLLTAAIILIVYFTIKGRNGANQSRDWTPLPDWLPLGAVRLFAYGLLAIMLLGSALYWFTLWQEQHELVRVQVVNANTGAIAEYRARRGSLDGRRFTTLDGQEIRLADVERMIVQTLNDREIEP